jgi:octaprenyl-diphosphate synthase
MDGLNTLPPFIEDKTSPSEGALEWMEEDLKKVDHEFRKNLRSNVPIISAIGEHLLRSGGKRFRAKLLLLSAKLCGYSGENHISMASLIEFIHTATLLHDDVVDNAKLRRGIESANSKWGNEACVLVGDFLFTKCFTRMVESNNWRILQTISRATTTMAEGEATQIGAILGNVVKEKEEALAEFGMDMGIAFQLIDDNLDYTSKKSGKKIGIDLQEGKITLPLIFTLRHCDRDEKAFIQETVNTHSITKKAFFRVVEIIDRYRGVQYTWEKAKEYVEKAKGHLHLFPNSKEKEALCALADYVLERRL